jgi:hypothetical protein
MSHQAQSNFISFIISNLSSQKMVRNMKYGSSAFILRYVLWLELANSTAMESKGIKF